MMNLSVKKLLTTTIYSTRIKFRQFATKKAQIQKAPRTLELLEVSSKLFKYHKLNSRTLFQPALS